MQFGWRVGFVTRISVHTGFFSGVHVNTTFVGDKVILNSGSPGLESCQLEKKQIIMATLPNLLKFKYEGEVSERLLCTLHELYAIYGSTSYFPRDFILRRLLELGSGLSERFRRGILPASFFVSLIAKLEINYIDFIEVLSSEYRTGDPWWTQNEAGQRYIMEVGIAVVQAFLDSGAKFTPMERAKIAAICDSCVSMFSLDARAVSSQHLLQLDRHFSALHLRLTAMSS
ncbi:unnamed protein product [Strongylus vulgaris]|uniref:Uncharacterized protein n=1 Tax=Strongylus vulgaris TaxID=40348 RepID=A0A3P7JEQ6_STRVU|nr:unnamed protein product [Strongylus vulgaris]